MTSRGGWSRQRRSQRERLGAVAVAPRLFSSPHPEEQANGLRLEGYFRRLQNHLDHRSRRGLRPLLRMRAVAMTASSGPPRTESPVQAWPAGFSGCCIRGDARSLAAFAVDGCVPMSSRCRNVEQRRLRAVRLRARVSLGSASFWVPAKERACLLGPDEVGTSMPDGPATVRGHEARNPSRPTMPREAPRSDGTRGEWHGFKERG